MSEDTTQAVVEETDAETAIEPNATAQPAPQAEATDARDQNVGESDLDDLLSHYDQVGAQAASYQAPSEPVQPAYQQPTEYGYTDENYVQPTGDLDATSADVLKRMDAWEARQSEVESRDRERQFKQDMDKTIQEIRGDLDPGTYDDTFMEAWVEAQARDDQRLQHAWADRHDNPKHFARVVETLGREFGKKFKSAPDAQATEDREAVSAAVRGASTPAPVEKPADYSNMNDNEFREEMEKKYGISPLI